VSKIRVLVVDDSVMFRRLLSDELSADPALEVVGTAANGRIALAKLTQVNPDLVTLDVEMPELDGIETLREIRKSFPKLPVVMFSALTERGASATLDALALGATDYFTKPSGTGGMADSLRTLREELIPAIKTLCGRPSTRDVPDRGPTAPPGAEPQRPRPITRVGPVEVVTIGTSTGGPNALAEVFSGLPADLPVPIVIVQHMPPMFTRLLAERLTAQSAVKVVEARTGDVLHPGCAWIAPGDYHMTVVREGTQLKVKLNQDPPENSCRPAADVLFASVARTFGSAALAVIMTGMGRDGFRGCELIRTGGGQIIAQDEASSVVWGMPGFVARGGLADRVLPLNQIAADVVRRVCAGRGSGT
jgi:two-component system chemotaxis response regulator CheB